MMLMLTVIADAELTLRSFELMLSYVGTFSVNLIPGLKRDLLHEPGI